MTARGVVTGRKTNGFFLQSPDDATDGDARTSEGVFVFTSAAPAPTITPGTMLSVTGRVIEFVPAADPLSAPLTEIGESLAIEIRAAGTVLPAPIEIRAVDLVPAGGHEQLERLEGMRVRVGSLVAVSGTLGSVVEATAVGTTNGVFYGVIAGSRPFREPGIDALQPLLPGAPCCVPRFDGNHERLRVDSDGQPGVAPLDVAVPATVSNLTGPLDYGFRSYTILPDAGASATPAAAIPSIRPAASDELSIASINLQRFFDNVDDQAVQDVVVTAAGLQTRLAKVSLYVRRLMNAPDVIAVQEVENLGILQTIAAVLNRDLQIDGAAAPHYEAYLEEGNDLGGIDVGVLVKRARVEVLEFRQEGKSEMFRPFPGGQPELLNDRPPLVLGVRATDERNAQLRVTLIVNHLRSLIDVEAATAAGTRVRAKRAAQAEFVASLVSRRLADDPQERILVVGDLNGFQFSDGYVDVVGTIRGAPAPRDEVIVETRDWVDPDLVNLVDELPPTQRYSYVFDGTAQVLDHMLATGSLRDQLSMFAYVRGNADSPEIWRSDARRPERISDHDAALAYFRLAR